MSGIWFFLLFMAGSIFFADQEDDFGFWLCFTFSIVSLLLMYFEYKAEMKRRERR